MVNHKLKKKFSVHLSNTWWTRAKGLIFSSPEGKALIFPFKKPQHASFHMFFVFFPIDLVGLDKNKRIIELRSHFLPFTFYTTKRRVSYVIELPSFTIEKLNLRRGDFLLW